MTSPRNLINLPAVQRTEDEIGSVLGQINQQIDEMTANYTERGDIDSSDTHRLRGLLDLIDEMGDGLALAATLDELATQIRHRVYNPSAMSTNDRRAFLASGRADVLSQMAALAQHISS
jgi:hypothetical protein